jgi:hypothetical protein
MTQPALPKSTTGVPAQRAARRGRRASRGTLLTVLGASATRPVVATVSGAPVPSAAASTASASSAPARPASFLRGAARGAGSVGG